MLSGTSSWSPPDASSTPFPRSLTTTVFSQRSTGWFSAFPRRTTLKGQQASISSTAPPMKDASYMTSSSAFVTHGCRTTHRVSRLFVRLPQGDDSGVTISVAEDPLWPPEPLSRRQRNRPLPDLYNRLSLCASLHATGHREPR